MTNAVRYSKVNDEVSILITNKQAYLPPFVSFAANRLYFLISDRGKGIPKEEQERIFSSFYQIEKAKKSINLKWSRVRVIDMSGINSKT